MPDADDDAGWPRRSTRDSADASADDRIDTRLDILETIGALSTPHQQVVVLRELEGMSYAEIAEVLNVPRGTVESRLFRARGPGNHGPGLADSQQSASLLFIEQCES